MKRILAVAIVLTACFAVSARAEDATNLATTGPGLLRDTAPADATPAAHPQAASSAPPSATQIPARHKSVTATVLLSLVIPGGGSLYTGQIGKGLLFLGTGIGGAALL